MTLLMIEGFDKYGGVNSNNTTVAALMAGEWTTVGGGVTIVAPLSATGQAALLSSNTGTLSKTLAANYGRIIGGVRFSCTLSTNTAGIQFTDAGTAQCGIGIATTGIISLRNGVYSSGTVLGSGATPVSANTTHYLEWDITLGNSAAYAVYLDGVSIISGTGDTTATANSTINGVQLTQGAIVATTWDDLYLYDTTGTANNAVLLTSPRIETQLPSADSAVQFAIGASVLGGALTRSNVNVTATANTMYLRSFTPSRACTLNSISVIANLASGTMNVRPVVYTDNAGVPNTLMSAGSVVVGIVAGATLTMPLTTPQSLAAGTPYWLGYMVDTTLTNAFQTYDALLLGRSVASTFTSGAPGTCPATTGGQATYMVYGNITLASAANFYEVSQQPPPGLPSYVFDATVAHEDLYNFPALSTPGATIHSVAIKSFAQKSDAGAKTMSLRTKSSATDSGGSLTGQALGTSFQWYGSFFPLDPNGNIAWMVANLNLATGGMRVDS